MAGVKPTADASMRPPLQARTVRLKVPFEDRSFELQGSADDLSVVDAIDKAGGSWEPEVMSVMRRVVLPDAVCLDIGANVGAHTLALASLAPRGRVYAFEPSARTFDFLRFNIASNRMVNATAIKLGLSNTAGLREFHYFKNYAGCSLSGGGGEGPDVDAMMKKAWGVAWERETETAEFTTLDAWADAAGLDRLDFVKMDVEGFERYVIEGGERTLRRFRPILISEFNLLSLNAYYGIDPQSYYEALARLYDHVYAIGPDASLRKLAGYGDLVAAIAAPRFWADIVCSAGELTD